MSHTTSPDTATGLGSIVFRPPAPDAPRELVAEAEIPLDHGPLAGLTLTGIRVWRHEDGPFFVTFPTRPAAGRPWQHIRATDGQRTTVDQVKTRILQAWDAFNGGQPTEPR